MDNKKPEWFIALEQAAEAAGARAYLIEHLKVDEAFETVVLLNWPHKGTEYGPSLHFGTNNGLEKTTSHVLFALGMTYPHLNVLLGSDLVQIDETTGHGNEVHSLYWNKDTRFAGVSWRESYVNPTCWKAFTKNVKIAP